MAVTQSVLLYGAPSWAHTLEYVPGNVAHINRVQRKALLRSICAYRTISETAANILSGVSPADLLPRERSMVSGKEVRSNSRYCTTGKDGRGLEYTHSGVSNWKLDEAINQRH